MQCVSISKNLVFTRYRRYRFKVWSKLLNKLISKIRYVENFCKLVKIWPSYHQISQSSFLDTVCMQLNVVINLISLTSWLVHSFGSATASQAATEMAVQCGQKGKPFGHSSTAETYNYASLGLHNVITRQEISTTVKKIRQLLWNTLATSVTIEKLPGHQDAAWTETYRLQRTS